MIGTQPCIPFYDEEDVATSLQALIASKRLLNFFVSAECDERWEWLD